MKPKQQLERQSSKQQTNKIIAFLNKNSYFQKQPVVFSLLVLGGIVFVALDKSAEIVYKGLVIVGLLVLVLGFRKVRCPSCGKKDAAVWNQVKKCPKCREELHNYGVLSKLWGLEK